MCDSFLFRIGNCSYVMYCDCVDLPLEFFLCIGTSSGFVSGICSHKYGTGWRYSLIKGLERGRVMLVR